MDFGSESLTRLVEEFARLPGIGRKTARRLSFYLLKAEDRDVRRFADALIQAKEQTVFCDVCHNLTEASPCGVCTDTRRADELICVVEEPSDVIAIEATQEFRGHYHVLHGVLSPLDGVGPDDLRVKELLARVREGQPDEVILALNPDTEGDATAFYLQKLLTPLDVAVSRIARGIPVGGDLEFADTVTLSRALAGRERMGE